MQAIFFLFQHLFAFELLRITNICDFQCVYVCVCARVCVVCMWCGVCVCVWMYCYRNGFILLLRQNMTEISFCLSRSCCWQAHSSWRRPSCFNCITFGQGEEDRKDCQTGRVRRDKPVGEQRGSTYRWVALAEVTFRWRCLERCR